MLWGWCCGPSCTEPFRVRQILCHQKPWCYVACFLRLSSGEFISTSSHICGSWYLPIFPLRDRSLTLMKMACLIDLANFWSSLMTVLKLSLDTSWPVVLWWSWMVDGAFIYSLYLSVNVLPDSLIYYSQSTLPNLYLYITQLFCEMVSLSLGLTRRSFIVLPPLTYSMFAADVFTVFPKTLDVRHHCVRFVGIGGHTPGVVGTSVGHIGFDVNPIKAWPWYFQFLNVCLRWSSSSFLIVGDWNQQSWLCVNMLITLY